MLLTQMALTLVLSQAASDLVVSAPPSLASTILAGLLSPGGLAALVSVGGAVLALVVGAGEVRRRRVALAAYHAFGIAEDLHAELPESTTITKVELGLKALNEYLLAHGWRPAKPDEQAVAKLTWSSMNGQTNLLTAPAPLNPPAPSSPR